MQRQLAELRQDGGGGQGDDRRRGCPISRSWPEQTRGADGAARRAGEAGAGRRRARHDRAAARAPRSQRSWPTRRSSAISARAQIALLQPAGGRVEGAAGARSRRRSSWPRQTGRDKDTQIANLGQRLNAALAPKVEELQRYRSEFFGKLREVLAEPAGHPDRRRPLRVPERGAVPGRQRRPDAGRRGPDHRSWPTTIKDIAQADPAGRELAAAGRRSCRPPADHGAAPSPPTGSCRRRARSRWSSC